MSTAAKALQQAVPAAPPMQDVVIAQTDDWSVLYINGKKSIEGHSLSESDIFQALGISVRTIWIEDEWVEKNGTSFPNDISGLPE